MLIAGFIFENNSIVLGSLGVGEFRGEFLEIQFMIDIYSSVFGITVRLISFCVIGFSHSYIIREPYNVRFILLIRSFVGSMFLLIFRCNLLFIIIG